MIVAEIGWNFLGDMDLAKKMVLSAKDVGCKYVKFQLWDPKNLKKGPWDEDGRREIYNNAYLTDSMYLELYNYATNLKLKCFASVFSDSDYDRLLKVDNDFIKIPSPEAHDLDLINRSLKDFKNVVVSTGALKKNELNNLKKFKDCENLYVLHCVSSYPLDYNDFNSEKFFYIKNNFKNFGYSGHCEGIDDALFALSNGATFIEKHFTTDQKLKGRDNKFAILPNDLKYLCEYEKNMKKIQKKLGLDLQKKEEEVYKVYRERWRN